MAAADRLAGVAEVARELGVGRTTVTQWTARRPRNGCPEPVAVLAMGPVFDLDEWVRWYAGYVPDKGGGRSAAPTFYQGA